MKWFLCYPSFHSTSARRAPKFASFPLSTLVFNSDLDPQVSRYSYKASNSSAEAAVASGRGQFVMLPSGRRALHMFPYREIPEIRQDCDGLTIYERVSGSFRDAWSQKPSGCIPVWQLNT